MFAIQQPKSQQCKYKQKHKEDLTCLNLIQIISKYLHHDTECVSEQFESN